MCVGHRDVPTLMMGWVALCCRRFRARNAPVVFEEGNGPRKPQHDHGYMPRLLTSSAGISFWNSGIRPNRKGPVAPESTPQGYQSRAVVCTQVTSIQDNCTESACPLFSLGTPRHT